LLPPEVTLKQVQARSRCRVRRTAASRLSTSWRVLPAPRFDLDSGLSLDLHRGQLAEQDPVELHISVDHDPYIRPVSADPDHSTRWSRSLADSLGHVARLTPCDGPSHVS